VHVPDHVQQGRVVLEDVPLLQHLSHYHLGPRVYFLVDYACQHDQVRPLLWKRFGAIDPDEEWRPTHGKHDGYTI